MPESSLPFSGIEQGFWIVVLATIIIFIIISIAQHPTISKKVWLFSLFISLLGFFLWNPRIMQLGVEKWASMFHWSTRTTWVVITFFHLVLFFFAIVAVIINKADDFCNDDQEK